MVKVKGESVVDSMLCLSDSMLCLLLIHFIKDKN